MKEAQRFYRATWWSAKGTGTVSFRADSLQLAWDHATLLCANQKEDMIVRRVHFIGTMEPTYDADFGQFVEAT